MTTEKIDAKVLRPSLEKLDNKYQTLFVPNSANLPIHSISAGKDIEIEQRAEGYYISGENLAANAPLTIRTFKTNA